MINVAKAYPACQHEVAVRSRGDLCRGSRLWASVIIGEILVLGATISTKDLSVSGVGLAMLNGISAAFAVNRCLRDGEVSDDQRITMKPPFLLMWKGGPSYSCLA